MPPPPHALGILHWHPSVFSPKTRFPLTDPPASPPPRSAPPHAPPPPSACTNTPHQDAAKEDAIQFLFRKSTADAITSPCRYSPAQSSPRPPPQVSPAAPPQSHTTPSSPAAP